MHALRETWNDERMHEFAARTEANFAEVRGESKAFRAEVREEFKEVREEFKAVGKETRQQGAELRAGMNERFAGVERRFDTLTGGMVAGFISLIVIHFVG